MLGQLVLATDARNRTTLSWLRKLLPSCCYVSKWDEMLGLAVGLLYVVFEDMN